MLFQELARVHAGGGVGPVSLWQAYCMPFEPNAKVWGPLLNGAAEFGDVELGRFVFDQLFMIEPKNTGNYIVMANLYSNAGKWEEAEIIRSMMWGVGLEKVPGCSWN